MPGMMKRAASGPSRRHVRDDSDEESDGDSHDFPTAAVTAELTEEQKQDNAAIDMLLALGRERRDLYTSSGRGDDQITPLNRIYRDRDCNQEGTVAAEKASNNKPQLASWNNFHNVDIKDGTVEDLPDIANGQTHRIPNAEKLRSGGVITLADTYDDRPRRNPIPPRMTTHAGARGTNTVSRGRQLSGGRGGGVAGRGAGARGGLAISGVPGYRPLDPAVIHDDKNSKYSKGGIQNKSMANPYIRIDSQTVKVTPAASRPGASKTGTRKLQVRPWPPAAFPEMAVAAAPLASPNNFMAFVNTKVMRPAKPPAAQPLAAQPRAAGPAPTAITIAGVSTAVTRASSPIKQVRREEFRAPVTPSELTSGKPSPEELAVSVSSPSESQEPAMVTTAPVGLGIQGLDAGISKDKEPVPVVVPVSAFGCAPTDEILKQVRHFYKAGNVPGLMLFLNTVFPEEPLPADKPKAALTATTSSIIGDQNVFKSTPTSASPGLGGSMWAGDRPRESGVPPKGTKPAKERPNPLTVRGGRAPSISFKVESKGDLHNSKFAPDTDVLKPKSANSAPLVPQRSPEAILGDLKNVSRLSAEAVKERPGPRLEYVKPKTTGTNRTFPRAGFEMLRKEIETITPKAEAKKQVAPVNNALHLSRGLASQFAYRKVEDKGAESDESEL